MAPKFSSSAANFCSGMEPSWLMEPQVAADAGAGGGRWRCDDEDDVELLGLPRPSSVRATPARWQKVVTQLWNPFVLFSLLPPSPPIPRPSGHPSDNDNVAFGIPTDLETVRRTGGPRKERRGEREGARRGASNCGVVVQVGSAASISVISGFSRRASGTKKCCRADIDFSTQ